ncbi:unnamed protein product [Candidatus Paraburkholderia kirkii UZHbot1]|uniref:Autoinducer 2 import system permease protein LsrD n=1 Tax=Candidatus Paraburkholderia kirkii UZHbot1 TaxID=1055526 RepID=U3UAN0_9BURK|nr:unnamed protein product [Candidatus Paraburkholderia kirkii UZHbot1]
MLAIVFVVSLIVGHMLSPLFLSSANISNMLADFTEIALIALPMTLIIVAAEIDLSVAAAQFSGIDVARTKLELFMMLGAMAALAGIVYTLRFTSARGDNGEGFELSGIAAVLFGGVSIFGGRGSMIGVLLTLADVSSETLTIVTGSAAAFVGADSESRRALAGGAREAPDGAGITPRFAVLVDNQRKGSFKQTRAQ